MTLGAAGVCEDFPVLDRRVNDHRLTYLDNAATTHTPTQVYDVFREFYQEYNANVHRGLHQLSHEASVASILVEHLEGMALADVAELDGFVASKLDGEFPAVRRECVVGPEDVIRDAAREYVTGGGDAQSTARQR